MNCQTVRLQFRLRPTDRESSAWYLVAMLKLFGNPASTCTRKVLFTLNETNTPYEFTVVDFAKGEHKAQPHLSRQPFGQVPALDDDGFALYESRAMVRYIDEKAGFKLTPKDIKQRAVMEQWISVETSNFTAPAMTFIYHVVFQRPQKAEDLEKASERLDLCCGIVDKALANKNWLAGDQISLAEVTYAPYIEYGMLTDAKNIFSKHSNLMSWWNRISERPAWRKAVGR